MKVDAFQQAWALTRHAKLLDSSPEAIRLSRFKWLSLEHSQKIQYPDYLILELIPFAKGLDGSLLAWANVEASRECPIVFSPRDEELAEIFAYDFSDAIFHLLVDELNDCWFDQADEGNTVWQLSEWLPRLKSILKHEQTAELSQVAMTEPTLSIGGSAAFLSPNHLQKLKLRFPFLNEPREKIRQYAQVDGP